jgi:pyridoxal phosphate enzyme (YggS family)
MIAENIKLLREEITRKCAEINRNSSEIKLIAVSKNFSPKEINEALNEGIKDFGENRAQELNSKFDVIGNKVTWHFIGHLQKNKVKYVVKSAEYIHSVDSFELAAEINKRAEKLNKVQKILLEIKTSFEETKSGIEEEKEIVELVQYCSRTANINLIGLMTIAPFVEDMNIVRNSFRTLRGLKEKLNSLGCLNVKELSMGMTSDYKIAIEEGATMLRIGSAIFGQRNY